MIRRTSLLVILGTVLAVAFLVAGAMVGLLATSTPVTPVQSDAAVGSSPTPAPTPTRTEPSMPPVSPAPSPASSPMPSLPPGEIPILYYHRVQAPPPNFATWSRDRQRTFLMYDTLPAAFRAQLDWLIGHGYTTILPRDLAAHWDLGQILPAKSVILSFDDGSPTWVTRVLPALRQRGMVAEFYLTLTAIAQHEIRWSDVQRLADAGNGIGAHDVHHVQLAGIPGGRPATPAVIWREITAVRSVIRAHVGTTPDSMAFVGGGYDATLLALVKKAGYTTARSINRGIEQSVAHRFLLRVVRIGARDDVIDPLTGTLVTGLPTFTARMQGVSDKRH